MSQTMQNTVPFVGLFLAKILDHGSDESHAQQKISTTLWVKINHVHFYILATHAVKSFGTTIIGQPRIARHARPRHHQHRIGVVDGLSGV